MIIAIVLLRQDGRYNYIYKYNNIGMAIIGVDALRRELGDKDDFLVGGESNEVNILKAVELP